MKKAYNAFTLKIIAIVGMILQHAAIILEEVIPYALQVPMHLAGGLTFPILAFFLVEGFKYTSSRKKYFLRLFIVAIISQVPFFIAYGNFWLMPLNIMFLLSMSLIMLHLHENMKSRGGFWVIFSLFLVISLMIEWNFIGFLMIWMYKIIKDEKKRTFWPAMMSALISVVLGIISVIFLGIIVNIIPDMNELAELLEWTMVLSIFFGLGNALSIYFIKRYNGERGKSMKYLFYVIYPLHFVVLALIANFLGILG